jgi:hypothetical protein
VTFSILQGQSLTGASFKSVDDLKAHIDAYIAEHNTTADKAFDDLCIQHRGRSMSSGPLAEGSLHETQPC